MGVLFSRLRIRKHLLIFSLAAPASTLVTYFGIGQEGKETLSSFNATGKRLLRRGNFSRDRSFRRYRDALLGGHVPLRRDGPRPGGAHSKPAPDPFSSADGRADYLEDPIAAARAAFHRTAHPDRRLLDAVDFNGRASSLKID